MSDLENPKLRKTTIVLWDQQQLKNINMKNVILMPIKGGNN